MKEYTIYFEMFGKKMKTSIIALSEEMAKDRLKEKIIIHKVEEIKKNTDMNDIFKAFGDIFGK